MKKMLKRSVLLVVAAILFLHANSTAQGIELFAVGKSCFYAVKKEGLFQVTNQGKDYRLIKAGKIDHLVASGDSLLISIPGYHDDEGFLLSINQGVDWEKIYPGRDVRSIAMYGNEFFTIKDKYTSISTIGKTTMTEIKALPGAVTFVGAIGSKIFASSSKGLYFSDGDRTKWQKCKGFEPEIFKESMGPGVSSVIAYGDLYYAGVHGYGSLGLGVFVSHDKGLTWQRIIGHRGGREKGYDDHVFSKRVSSLASLGQTLFAGDVHGPLYISNNQGVMWTRSDLGFQHQNISTLAVLGTDVYALAGGNLYVSHNTGKSWVNTQASSSALSPDDLVKLENQDKEYVLEFENRLKLDSAILLECQFFKNFPPGLQRLGPYTSNGSMVIAGASESGYGLYKSVDEGASWSKINNGFKRPLYKIPESTFIYGSGSRIFVGTDMLGLFYSDDNGNSWTGNTDELPTSGVMSFDNFLAMESMFRTDSALHLIMQDIEGDFVSLDNGRSWKHSGGKTMEELTKANQRKVLDRHADLAESEAEMRATRLAKYHSEHPINYSDIPRTTTGPDYRGLSNDRFMERNNHRDNWISSQGAIHTSP